MDRAELSASDRLLARHPEARVWMRQIGSRYARRFGPRFKKPWPKGGAGRESLSEGYGSFHLFSGILSTI
jgi:hypothetical protein